LSTSNVGNGASIAASPFETISLKPIKSPTISNIKPIKVQHTEDDPVNIQLNSTSIKLQRNHTQLHEELQKLKDMLDRKIAREELEKNSQGLIYSTLTDSLEIVKNKMIAENKQIADIASPEINIEHGLLP